MPTGMRGWAKDVGRQEGAANLPEASLEVSSPPDHPGHSGGGIGVDDRIRDPLPTNAPVPASWCLPVSLRNNQDVRI